MSMKVEISHTRRSFIRLVVGMAAGLSIGAIDGIGRVTERQKVLERLELSQKMLANLENLRFPIASLRAEILREAEVARWGEATVS